MTPRKHRAELVERVGPFSALATRKEWSFVVGVAPLLFGAAATAAWRCGERRSLHHIETVRARFDMTTRRRFMVSGTAAVTTPALTPAPASRSAMFEAITRRQSTRAEYDGKAVTSSDLQLLERAGTGKTVRSLRSGCRPTR